MNLRQRQVHLDFHTGPAIPDVGAEFDAVMFAQRFDDAASKLEHTGAVGVMGMTGCQRRFACSIWPSAGTTTPRRLPWATPATKW